MRPTRKIWWLSDVVLWTFIALGTWGVIDLWQRSLPVQQTFHLSFRDASELSQGCQVRMMGREVGMVKAVRFEEDHVSVDIIMDRDSPPVPPGAWITIEFTGLAGSKSVDIYPPSYRLNASALNQQPLIRIKQPIRMQDVQTGQIVVADALKEGAENFSRLLGSNNDIHEAQDAILITHDNVVNTQAILTDADVQIVGATGILHTTLSGVSRSLDTFNGNLKKLVDTVEAPSTLKPSIRLAHQTQHTLLTTKTNLDQWYLTNNPKALFPGLHKRKLENSKLLHHPGKAEKALSGFQHAVEQFHQATNNLSALTEKLKNKGRVTDSPSS